MEGKESEVVLIGTWASAFCKRVELALKLKGIPYEFVEEDLENKSELLLRNNPVHKKVPVLLHKGKAIPESLVILEYLDEYWTKAPSLLPEDPYQRAKIRFWANYYDEKIAQAITPIIFSEGKEREKFIEDFQQLLKVFEEGIERDFQGQSPFLNGGNLGFLDLVVGTHACNYEAYHDSVAVVFEAEKNPLFFSWLMALKDHPRVKETLPPSDKLATKFKEVFLPPYSKRIATIREKYLQSPKA
ncbi:hypothetical protein SLA2020_028090 [Shorea laevis]